MDKKNQQKKMGVKKDTHTNRHPANVQQYRHRNSFILLFALFILNEYFGLILVPPKGWLLIWEFGFFFIV